MYVDTISIFINNIVFFTYRYNVRWYAAPIRIQKLILILLQKGQRAFGLNSMGGFFTALLHCFATV